MAGIPGADEAAKAAQQAKKAADEVKQTAAKATQAVEKAAKALDDAKKTADKARQKAKQAMDLAKQAYDLAKDPALRDKAFAAAQQKAAELHQKADKALGDAASAFRDAADGANQVYSALQNLGGFEMIPEVIRQQIPAVPNLVPQGAASKLGQAVDQLQALPAAAASAAARALNAIQMPAMPAPPSSPAVLPCSVPMPAPPALKQAAVDGIANAMGNQAAAFEPFKQQLAALKPIAENMLAAGMEEAKVAEIINWRRRELTNLLPEPVQSYVRAVNQKKYGDPLGRSHEAAKELLQSGREIIDSACQPPDKLGKLVDGAKKWLDDMPTDEVAKVADKLRGLKP